MADEKLNTGPAENISPEAAEPITTPEQAAASEPQQEQTGPAIPESGDVVVSFDKINDLRNRLGPARAAHPRRIRRPLTSPSRPNETKCPEAMERPRMPRSPLSPHRIRH